MFRKIFAFEFLSSLRNPSIYLYAFSFFAIAFLSLAGSLDVFDSPVANKELQRHLNSPYELTYIMLYFNKIFLFLLPSIIGAGIYKDFQYNLHSILFSFPLNKAAYLGGKFLSTFCICLLICVFACSGLVLAELMPSANPTKLGPFQWSGYFQALFIFLIPNLLYQGLILFSLVLLSRNIFIGFLGIVILFLLQLISENAFAGQDFWLALLDPFAQNTSLYLSQFWTIAERNEFFYPLDGILLYNRLFWLSIAAAISVFFYRNFHFHQEQKWKWKLMPKRKKSQQAPDKPKIKLIPQVQTNFNWRQKLKSIFQLSLFNFNFIIHNWTFFTISLIACLSVIFSLERITHTDEMVLLPATQLMLRVPAFFFLTSTILLTFIYSGSLMHRDRISKMNVLIDSSPVSNAALLFSKFFALLLMQSILLLLMILCGIGLQISQGYYEFELDLYFFHLFGLKFWGLMVWAITAIFIHSLFPNLYQGLFVLLLMWLGISGMPSLGINSHALLFNSPPELSYSDLSAYDHQLKPYFWVQSYWILFSLILLCLSLLIWQRGVYLGIKERWKQFKGKLGRTWYISLAILSMAFLAVSAKILWEESLSQNPSNKSLQAALKDFEAAFKSYKNIPQPRIRKLSLKLDIYPEEKSFAATGSYTLVNPHQRSLDTLMIRRGFDEVSQVDMSSLGEKIQSDEIMKFSIWKLHRAMKPGDSLEIHFSIQSKPNSFFDQYPNIRSNGSFLREDILPRLGYIHANEEKDPLSANPQFNYQSRDSDSLQMEFEISTSEGQYVVAPGSLEQSYLKEGRRIFLYRSQRPIKFAFGILSASYEIEEELWEGVKIKTFAHPTHNKNLASMLTALKASLTYNSNYFGPYQHKSAEIVEFPLTEGSFATTYANIIPTSEFRFLSNAAIDTQKVDIAFYSTAHELTHQWWGNQLMPAHAQGARMLTESITEYISLKIFEKAFGKKQARKFLGFQRRRYLQGRARIREAEAPLYLVKANQQFLFYGKGTIAMHSLSHFLGETAFNHVLAEFMDQYRFKGPPYSFSTDFLQHLEKSLPDSLSYLIEDNFRRVIFHELSFEKVQLEKLGDEYELNVKIAVKKKELIDRIEKEKVDLHELVEIGIYDETGKSLMEKRFWIDQGSKQLKVRLKNRPYKIVLDPNLLLIEKEIGDNQHILD